MYAIVEIAGQQFKVSPGTKVYVNRLEAKEGSKVEFDNVLLVDDEGKIQVGTPKVDGVKVEATVLSHLKGDKVIVFQKKRRKGYQKANGHRQFLSQLQIDKVGAGKAKKAAAPKKEAAPKAAAEKEEAPKKAAAKKAPAKKAAPKKAAAKKAAPKKKKEDSE